MKMKQAMHNRDAAEARQKVEDGETDENAAASFQIAKHRHGFINRVFRIGEVFDESKLLSFKKSMIKKALLKQNRDLDAEAVQAFKNVMSYMVLLPLFCSSTIVLSFMYSDSSRHMISNNRVIVNRQRSHRNTQRRCYVI
jgi:hypothetical protein